MLERILDDANIQTAMQRVKSNGGTFGVDRMELSKLDDYMKENLEEIRHEIRTRTFVPNPVRRVEIPKPNGGVRKLGYYRIGDMKNFLAHVSEHLRTMLRIIIWKQWKVPSKRQWGLEKLGIDRDRARQTAYMGDHYQFVCTKLCVKNAISKGKLVRKGLVDPLDYYLGKVGSGVGLNCPLPNGTMGGVRGDGNGREPSIS